MESRTAEKRVADFIRTLTFVFAALAYTGEAVSSKQGLEGVTGEYGSRVAALKGSRATLPCATSPRDANDTTLLVVWYRENVPVFSFDMRSSEPVAWSETSVLGGRAHFRAAPPYALNVDDVRESDAGFFRCRVDYNVSPSKYYEVTFDVIVPPSKPIIFDENGKQLQGTAGPYQEGSDVQLTCMVAGGKPSPTVRWWRGSTEVLNTSQNLPSSSSTRKLVVLNVTRSDLHARYRCEADNSPLAPPQATHVVIEMLLPSLEVEIPSREQPLSAGRPAQISCRTAGARPPAIVTWWLDGVQVHTHGNQKELDDGNVTLSTLTLTPRMEDDGKALHCRAQHRTLPRAVLDAVLHLNVHYAPVVSLELGSNMNPQDMEEGDDVYFECRVRANPPAYKIVWEHNGHPVAHSPRAGVIVGAAHLALQAAPRSLAGSYLCRASNVEGDTISKAFQLNLMYKPICKDGLQTVYGAGRMERVRVLCAVDSHPPPDSFTWLFNSSGNSVEVAKERYSELEPSSGRSILTYTPLAEQDFGTLLCHANNRAGRQQKPCAFTLVPAARPDPPHRCSVHNQTEHDMIILCEPGYDGGEPQEFVAEVWEGGMEGEEGEGVERPVANVTSPRAAIALQVLPAGRALQVRVYAQNARGRSEAVLMRTHTLEAERQGGVVESWGAVTVAGAALGAALAATLLACLAALAVRAKRRNAGDYVVQSLKPSKAMSVSRSENDSPSSGDDRNPDVVPPNKDANRNVGAPRTPAPPPYERARAPPPRVPSNPQINSSTPYTYGWSETGTAPRREIVTTRTPLLAVGQQESCV